MPTMTQTLCEVQDTPDLHRIPLMGLEAENISSISHRRKRRLRHLPMVILLVECGGEIRNSELNHRFQTLPPAPTKEGYLHPIIGCFPECTWESRPLVLMGGSVMILKPTPLWDLNCDVNQFIPFVCSSQPALVSSLAS